MIETDAVDDAGDINVYICNVISNFIVARSIDLKMLARNGNNVYYNERNNSVRMESTRPKFHATIWTTGKVVCAGGEDLDQAYYNARYICKSLKNLGFEVKMKNYKVINVMGALELPYCIDLVALSNGKYGIVSYDGTMHPGATLTLLEYKAVFKVFSSGKVTIMTTTMDNTYKAIDKFIDLMHKFQCDQKLTVPKFRLK